MNDKKFAMIRNILAGLFTVLFLITIARIGAQSNKSEKMKPNANRAAVGHAMKRAVPRKAGNPETANVLKNVTAPAKPAIATDSGFQPRPTPSQGVTDTARTEEHYQSPSPSASHQQTTGNQQSNGSNPTQLQLGQTNPIRVKKPWQQTTNPVRNWSLSQICQAKGLNGSNLGLRILVDKSSKTLSVFAGSVWLKNYPIELGDNGLEDKFVSGDHKTPEGTFYISEVSVLNPTDAYLGSRWMRLSYPAIEDAQRGLGQHLIDSATFKQIVAANRSKATPPQRTALGGGVGIHGGTTPAMGSNWTWGCVGLSNQDVEEIFPYVTVGTPVVIQY